MGQLSVNTSRFTATFNELKLVRRKMFGVRDFQLFVYNGNAFLFSGYPLGIRYADKLAGCKKVTWEICWLPKSDVGNLLAAKK